MNLSILIFSSKKSILKTPLFEKGIMGKYLSYFPPKTTYASDWLTSLVSQSEASFLAGNSFYIFPPCPFQKTVLLYIFKISSTVVCNIFSPPLYWNSFTAIPTFPLKLRAFFVGVVLPQRGKYGGSTSLVNKSLHIDCHFFFKILEKNFSVILWPNSPASNGWNIKCVLGT